LDFLDHVRYSIVLLVVVYHAVAPYTTTAPHWPVHDSSSVFGDITRQVLDVFIMPILFFVAGYFTLPSLQRKGTWLFIKGKLNRLGIPWLLVIFTIVPLAKYDTPTHVKGGVKMYHPGGVKVYQLSC